MHDSRTYEGEIQAGEGRQVGLLNSGYVPLAIGSRAPTESSNRSADEAFGYRGRRRPLE